MDQPIGVGLIGCGGMGAGLANAVQAATAGKMVAFYDADAEHARAVADQFEGRVCETLEGLLADEGVQAVVIATPPHVHEEQAVASARAGKHVYTEKPMALSVVACDNMIDAAREAGVTLMVGQVLRLYEPFHSILRWSREGRFGRPFHACIQRVSSAWGGRGSWRQELATVGGMLYEVGAHELDFMRCLLGEPTQVYGVRQKVRAAEHEVEDIISLLARFTSGGSGHYDSGVAWGESKFTFVLCFEEATLVSERAFDAASLRALTPAREPEEIPLEGFQTENAVQRQMRGWLEALLEGRAVPVPGEEGRETVRLAEAAYRSAETGELEIMPAAGE